MKIEIKLREQDVAINQRYSEEVIDYFLKASKEQLIADIKSKTPVKHGILRGSWNAKQSKNRLTITNSTKYAIFVEEGTGIFKTGHRIFPKNASVFRAVIDKQVVYFRHHKGRPAKHMMKKGVEKYVVKIPNLFRTAVHKTSIKKGK